MKITYLGHSAFEFQTENYKILIDPFLIKAPDYDVNGVTDIFVTHGHSDHLGNAIDISRKTGAEITAIFELANYCTSKGANANGISFGGWIKFPWGKAIAVPAFHSSSSPEGFYTGSPCGFIFEIENKIIYHAGDNNLNSEMKIIGEVYKPELAMLPIGGHYTMDIDHATIASQWIGAEKIIPMHYGTFEVINVDIESFKTKISEVGKNPVVLAIREGLEF